MGRAIIRGLLAQKVITVERIEVTVQSSASLQAIGDEFGKSVIVREGDNVSVAERASIVLLACPPGAMGSILSEKGMSSAIHDKPLISVLAGVTTSAMESLLKDQGIRKPSVFRALPNLAIATCSSATAIEIPPTSEHAKVVDIVFQALGGVTYVPADCMNAATVMCGSTPAYIALVLDGMIDGAVASGVPREKARSMAAQMLSSTAALLQSQSPSELRETVCAMPGCTIQGNLVLEEGRVRGTAAIAVKTAIQAASKLG